EQLGEMTIQLVKIDGEMIAKITVSSQATKSALESNLHQLKNMFAPHQVLIEKQDGDEQATFDQEDTSEEQHKSSHGNEKEQHAEDQPEHSFEEQFEQILAEAVGEP
ncbi:MAG TPA: flagellar hook-length control protein FliK, partial [Bacillota bacterium]|nr:flagellar hook-length control protein FliK [Bacillota bacterium]